MGGYRIDALIGVGGMGEVYRAHDLRLDRDVALKVLARRRPIGRPTVRAVETEARAASRLNHPNIVDDPCRGRRRAALRFIAMELVQGQTLRERAGCRPAAGAPRR